LAISGAVLAPVGPFALVPEGIWAPEFIGLPEFVWVPVFIWVPEFIGVPVFIWVPEFIGVPVFIWVPEFVGAPVFVWVPGFTVPAPCVCMVWAPAVPAAATRAKVSNVRFMGCLPPWWWSSCKRAARNGRSVR
jgi:hypothetical protein